VRGRPGWGRQDPDVACPPQAWAELTTAADRKDATPGWFLANGNDASAASIRFKYPSRRSARPTSRPYGHPCCARTGCSGDDGSSRAVMAYDVHPSKSYPGENPFYITLQGADAEESRPSGTRSVTGRPPPSSPSLPLLSRRSTACHRPLRRHLDRRRRVPAKQLIAPPGGAQASSQRPAHANPANESCRPRGRRPRRP
jgi:hypothetical protein